MDFERARTYEALDEFIQSQRALLDDLRGDIAKLQALKTSALDSESSPSSPASPTLLSCASSPPGSPNHETTTEMEDDSDSGDERSPSKGAFLEGLATRLRESDAPFEISDISKARLELPPKIGSGLDWGLFSGSDPKPLQSLASTLTKAYTSRNTPSAKPASSPTVTQQFIRAGRRALLDPILKTSQTYIHELSLTLPSSDDEDEKLSPEELKREREREKLRELKKRKIRGWGGLGLANTATGLGGGGRMRQGQLGVFIRRDVEDETGDVDVTMDEAANRHSPIVPQSVPDEVESRPSHAATPDPAPVGGKTIAHLQAARRLAERKRIQSTKVSPKKKNLKKVQLPKAESDDDVEMNSGSESNATSARNGNAKMGKPKSETYKQAWTDEEQQLLERLLEEIPEGEKNRWQKISRAMNGKRTPRQVASRVQKYFEKLRRFGVN